MDNTTNTDTYLEGDMMQQEQNAITIEHDVQRIIDGSNIILAIQEYYFTTDTFPKDLEELKEEGFLTEDNALEDPETAQLYYYEKRDYDFIFCVQLHDKTYRGFNTNECSQ